MLFALAVVVSCLNPVFGLPIVITDYIRSRKPFRSSILIGIIYSYISFFARSIYAGDLERYMVGLNNYKGRGLIDCIINSNYSWLVSDNVFFWVCSHFRNERIMIVLTTFILYFISYYIIFNVIQNSTTEIMREMLLLSITILPFYLFISSLRSSLGISFCTLALYFDLCKDKNIGALMLYTIGILFHPAAIAIVLLRILYLFCRDKIYLWTMIVFIIVVILGLGFVHLSPNINGPIGDFAKMIMDYSSSGQLQNSKWAEQVRSSIFSNVWKAFWVCVIFFCLIRNDLKKKNKLYRFDNLISFSFLYCTMVLGMMFFPTAIYMRYITGGFPLIIALLSKKNSNYNIKNAFVVTSAISIIGLLFQLYSFASMIDLNDFLIGVFKGIFNLFDI